VSESFDPQTPVLYYEPDCRPLRYARKQRRWLLWPAWAHRVVAPLPQPRRFNLFQEYVLKLCGAGVRTAPEIGRRLGFGQDLAAYILMQLRGFGLLNDEAAPTDRARKELAEQESNRPVTVAGLVFQDPFEGGLWPRFLNGALNQIEVRDAEWREKGVLWFHFTAGTHGKPIHEGGPAIVPPYHLPRPALPTAQEILAACRQHRRQ
jgi:hypothetical protein